MRIDGLARTMTGVEQVQPPRTELETEAAPAARPVDHVAVTDEAGEDDGEVSPGLEGLSGEVGANFAGAPSPQAPPDPGGGKEIGGDPEEVTRQEQIQESLGSGEPVEIVNSLGQTQTVRVQRGDSTERDGESFDGYSVQVGDASVRVELPPGVSPDEALGRVSDYVSQVPEHLRGDLKTITVHAGEGRKFTLEDGTEATAAATAADGRIDFYDGLNNLQEDTFHHEFGHVLGDAVEDRQAGFFERNIESLRGGRETDSYEEQYIPEGYSDAASRDGNSVSQYGNENRAEDFGDFWRDYVAAQAEGPEALEELRKEFPNRFVIADDIYTNRNPDAAAA